ncbi:MAG: ParB N-terminal domain-containing protein [Bryobacteraceae bacterium]
MTQLRRPSGRGGSNLYQPSRVTVVRIRVNVRKFGVGGLKVKSNPMKIEIWPVDKPVPYPKNARKISDQAIEKVASSIQAFGFRQPIVVDKA